MMNFFNMGFDINTVLQIFTKVLIVFLILPIHEFAHAWAAHKMGDDTAAYMGRLTLNPLAHIDVFGAICLVLTGFGWAKPVPINPVKFRRPRFGTAVTAAAGPLSNLIVAIIALVAYRIIECTSMFHKSIQSLYDVYSNIDEFMKEPFTASTLENAANSNSGLFFLFYVLEVFIIVNIGLAIFNLIPIPPLDGSKILQYFTSAKFDQMVARYAQQINIVFMIVVLSGVLSKPLGFVNECVRNFLWFITGFIPSLMGA